MRADSGYVGMNQDSPATRLDVKQNNGVAYNNRVQSIAYGAARFFNESGHTSGGTYTGFQFNLTGDSQNRICSIGMISEASNTRNSSLVFATDDNGNRTEKVRITSTGIIGFNNTAPEGKGIDVAHSRTNGYSPTTDTRNLAHIIARNSSDAPGRFAALSFINGGGTQAEGSINLVQRGNYTGDLTFKLRTAVSTWREALRIASSGSAATDMKMIVDGYLQLGGYNNTDESFVNLATLFSARDMFGSTLISGQTDTISGYARRRQTSDGSGTFFFGPYGAFPAGDYTALFRLKVADRSGSSTVGYIDVIGNGIGIQGRNTAPRTGTGQSVNMTLQTNDFTESDKYQYFALDFSKSNSSASIETRFLSYAANTDIYLDHVLVLPRLNHGVEGVSGMFDY